MESSLLKELRNALETDNETAQESVAEVLGQVRQQLRERKQRDDDDVKGFTELESLVQRRLGPVDRFVARQLRQKGTKTDDIAAILLTYPVVSDSDALKPTSPLDLRMILPEQHALYLAQLVGAGALPRPAFVLAADWAVLTEVALAPLDRS